MTHRPYEGSRDSILMSPDASLVELVEAIRTIPYRRPSDRTVDGMLREGCGTCSTKHLFLAQRLKERWPDTDPSIIHRVYRVQRRDAQRWFGRAVAAVVPLDGLVDVHRYLMLSIGGQRIQLDVTLSGPPWDGLSSLPLMCGPGRDHIVRADPDAEKLALERMYCNPSEREPFIAAIASHANVGMRQSVPSASSSVGCFEDPAIALGSADERRS